MDLISAMQKESLVTQIITLQEKLDKCGNVRQMIPLLEEFLKMLYRITGDSKAEKKFSSFVNARSIIHGCNQNTNRSRIGRVGSGKVANTKDPRNSARK